MENLMIAKKAETTVEIHPILATRWSPRTFNGEVIPESEIKQLFEAVRWAASSYNGQPWRFVYAVKGTSEYDSMFSCLSEFNQKWAGLAPVLILTAYKEKTEEGDENFHALHDLGMCMGNMSVQAESMGIAMHHMAGLDWEKAQQLFEVPDGFHIATAVALGYYGGEIEALPEELRDQETAERTRNKIGDFAFKGSWGK